MTDETKGPLGAWILTVTPNVPNTKPHKVLTVINAGGTVLETDLFTSRVGMGAWKQTGEHTFDYVFVKQLFDADGNHKGMSQLVHHNTLNSTCDEFDGTCNVTMTDPNGNVVSRGSATYHATRIEVPTTV